MEQKQSNERWRRTSLLPMGNHKQQGGLLP
nr:MAG TPA: hypothetical protein [Caudoviricetes sp.]